MTPTFTESPRVPAIEQALDALYNAPPKSGEKVHAFVRRCANVVNGKKQRTQLFAALIESLGELGVKPLQPASAAQVALRQPGASL